MSIVKRWITADRLSSKEFKTVFAVAGGLPEALRMDSDPVSSSKALQKICVASSVSPDTVAVLREEFPRNCRAPHRYPGGSMAVRPLGYP